VWAAALILCRNICSSGGVETIFRAAPGVLFKAVRRGQGNSLLALFDDLEVDRRNLLDCHRELLWLLAQALVLRFSLESSDFAIFDHNWLFRWGLRLLALKPLLTCLNKKTLIPRVSLFEWCDFSELTLSSEGRFEFGLLAKRVLIDSFRVRHDVLSLNNKLRLLFCEAAFNVILRHALKAKVLDLGLKLRSLSDFFLVYSLDLSLAGDIDFLLGSCVCLHNL
jgi:hypothetical protein